MPRFRAVLLLMTTCLVMGACAPAGAPGSDPSLSAEPWVSEMLTRINAERAAVGSAPLQLCATLGLAAQAHSQDQAAMNRMSHAGSNRSTMTQRDEAAGYVGWNALAENVAEGYGSASDVMDGWMNSRDHKANLLSTSYVHVGLGRATSASGQLYWTQDFGRGGSC